MNHKISIENLGPIKKIKNLEIKDVNLVIGESASGKSVLAKAVFFFHSLFLGGHFAFPHSRENTDFRIARLLEGLFPAYSDYKLEYCYSDDLIMNIQKRKKREYHIEVSDAFENKISDIDERIKEVQNDEKVKHIHQEIMDISKRTNDLKIQETLIRELLEKISNKDIEKINNKDIEIDVELIERELFSDLGLLSDILFIPATRSFVYDFDDIRLSRMNNPEYPKHLSGIRKSMMFSGDATLRQFSNIHRRFIRGFEFSEPKHDKILKGRLSKNETTGTIRLFVNDNALKVDQFSSGQKGLVPIIIILMGLIKQKNPAFIIVEEPEAHIFPHDQKRIFDLIIEVAKKTRSKVFITTHSPYILMSANNLIAAEEKNYTKFRNKFIPFDNINAQKLLKGVNKSILDREDKLIDGEYIENIVDEIMDNFNEILNEK